MTSNVLADSFMGAPSWRNGCLWLLACILISTASILLDVQKIVTSLKLPSWHLRLLALCRSDMAAKWLSWMGCHLRNFASPL